MNLTRRELKFQIPERLIQPIIDYVSPYMEMDKYSQIAPEGYYTINSLYLDSDQMGLLQEKRVNAPSRFSMRIRSYGDQPKYPAFLEIKYRVNQFIRKQRSRLDSEEVFEYFRGENDLAKELVENDLCLNKAGYEIVRRGLKPKIMTQYQRMAFFGRFETYSRLTFDRRLRCYPEDQYQIFPKTERFSNYDQGEFFVSGQAEYVLELKTELKVPFWMLNLIRHFELRQMQFSKFDSSWTQLENLDYSLPNVHYMGRRLQFL